MVGMTVGNDGFVDPTLAVTIARGVACASIPAGGRPGRVLPRGCASFRYVGGPLFRECDASRVTKRLAETCSKLTGMQAAARRGLLVGLGECDSMDDRFERDPCQGYVIAAECEIPTPVEKTTQACLFGRAMAAGDTEPDSQASADPQAPATCARPDDGVREPLSPASQRRQEGHGARRRR